MEWNRGTPGAPSTNQTANAAAPTSRRSKGKIFKSLRIASVALLFSITVLIIALVAYAVVGGNSSGESKYVNTKQMQAVFLNGGQVYFGRINTLNDKYMRLSDIYYLRVNQQVQPNQQGNTQNDISLVKLGCELHGPQDQMLINRDQIIFWENLKDDGQVAKAVTEYKKQNPNGQQCQTNSQSNNTNTNTTPTTPTTPSTSTTKKP